MLRQLTRKSEYTVSEVAAILQVNPETVRRFIRDGTPRGPLPAVKLGMGTGAGYRVSHTDLERFIKALYPYLSIDVPGTTEGQGH